MEALWRNWLTRPTSNRKIVGSSPTGAIMCNFFLRKILHSLYKNEG